MIDLLAALLLGAGLAHADPALAGAAPVGASASAAAQASAAALTPAAADTAGAMDPADVYYGPSDDDGATPDAAESKGLYISRARISAFAWGSPGVELPDADLVLNGAYIGRSPLQLKGMVVDKPLSILSATLPGYEAGLRPALRMPADGDVKVAVLSDNAAGWYTAPAWAVGLGLVVASVFVYRSESTSSSLALAGGGVAVIAAAQLAANLLHLPALRRAVQAYNARPDAVPAQP